MRDLSGAGRPGCDIAHGPGWWRRDLRLEFQPVFRDIAATEAERTWRSAPGYGGGSQPLLIAGATGTLGMAFARACEWRGLDYVLTDRTQLDLDDPKAAGRVLARHRPWAVINATGFVDVDEAERHPENCMAANAVGPLNLARACVNAGAELVCFSSDLVFDGSGDRPLVESDPAHPLNVYGHSKARLERGMARIHPHALIVRTAAFFSPFDRHNFAARLIQAHSEGRAMAAAKDLFVSPTYVPDLVEATLDLLIDGERGLWHLTNVGEISWARFALEIAGRLGLDAGCVTPVTWRDTGMKADRPRNVALASERGAVMPSFADALSRYAVAMSAGLRCSLTGASPAGRAHRRPFAEPRATRRLGRRRALRRK